ncbi:C39 family peptidase [Nocardioidaceae bacterium]|nr:C39 family peptidase [Nocardioidaceae bacterium]
MNRHPAGSTLTVATMVAALAATAVISTANAAPAEAAGRRILDTSWDTAADFARGTGQGIEARGDTVRVGQGARRTRFTDVDGVRRQASVARWTSPWVATEFGATEMIPSWRARTPRGTLVVVQARGRDATGSQGSWDTVARWAAGDHTVLRRSGGSQVDDLTSLATDTLRATSAADGRIAGWQVRISLVKADDARRGPVLQAASLVATRVPSGPNARASRPAARGLGVDLDVPAYSQMIHRGEYPQWGGGGEVWCSPTTMSMLMAFWDRLPAAKRWRWVDDAYADPWVDHGARSTYDYTYRGAGNWAFTTAYAGSRLPVARVTRLRNLRAAQQYVAAGVPLGISIAFDRGQLDGSPLTSTGGHLLVIRGFTESGDVIVNDPAAESNAGVRRVYDRAQLEAAWQRRSGGLTYVVAPKSVTLP